MVSFLEQTQDLSILTSKGRNMQGRILKGIGGFYYVQTDEGIIECKARGRFRKEGISPLPGDFVEIAMLDEATGSMDRILPRKNSLIRPPVANIERMFIVAAATRPKPVLLLIDKVIAVCEKNDIDPIVIVNKCDLSEAEGAGLAEIYREAGFPTLMVSAETGEGMEEIRKLIHGCTCAFSGNSGVGKSSIINALDLGMQFEVGAVSEKIARGRHTTRHVELVPACGGFIADTPGFGDVGIERFQMIRKEELPDCFREFSRYEGKCRFTGCAHIKEKDCAILEALEKGEIAKSRHESYVTMYEEVKDYKEWENK